jgi:hypothetical protein
MKSCRTLFLSPTDRMEGHEDTVYRSFSNLSLYIQHLRNKGLASGEVSRCNQYLSRMMVSFESVKHIYQYRTPISLRAYSNTFIVLLPVAYGPYFAGVAADQNIALTLVLPVLFSLILVSLDNIQAHLENPFDQVGVDDVRINAEKFVARLHELTAQPGTGLAQVVDDDDDDDERSEVDAEREALAEEVAAKLDKIAAIPGPETEDVDPQNGSVETVQVGAVSESGPEADGEVQGDAEVEPEPEPTDVKR